MTASGVKFYMDAVFSVSYVQSGTASEYALQTGVKASDHYSQDTDTINISGSVSSVKFVGRGEAKTELEVFEKELTALKKSGETFNVSFSDNLTVYPNCLFTNLSMDRNTTTGAHAIDVQISIKQIQYGSAAGIVDTPTPAKEYADMVEDKKKSAGNTKELSTNESERLKQIQNELAANSFAPGLAVQ